jgi:hypothetical protein
MFSIFLMKLRLEALNEQAVKENALVRISQADGEDD